ncbi:hypothetical protein [Streptomyces johnsoniae]|uniref:Uncharacterized protein n=1 Tax=Streptomyces johnsoniae TaxID=3075532 RepID=A0ABU2SA94_9ACTN|nr:hypothetical protein [Streptomyces sp. DSM 41886]MDT0445892.1 hypothetical protein [Streptomyces sp. DSM 41886]
MALGTLAACGGGSDDDDGSGNGSGGTDKTGTGGDAAGQEAEQDDAPAAPVTQLTVPAAYDTGRGWETALPPGAAPLTLPGSGAVALFDETSGTDGRFTVHDAATGEVLWSSAALEPVGESASLEAFATTVNGEDYLVAWSAGTSGAGVIDRGDELVVLDIFTADGSGDAVEPLHHVEVPGSGEAAPGGAGLMLELEEDIVVGVDPATGVTTEYDESALEPPPTCKDCDPGGDIVALTANGPLVDDSYAYEGFWVPGGWAGEEVAPREAGPDAGASVTPVGDGLVIAEWSRSDGQTIRSVLDSASGTTAATALCPEPDGSAAGAEHTAMSANGRYLVHGVLVFDLEEGTGHCFEATPDANAVQFSAVTDAGVAFGVAEVMTEDSWVGTPTPVQLDIASGEVAETAPEAVFPVADLGGAGLFTADDETLVAYLHAG